MSDILTLEGDELKKAVSAGLVNDRGEILFRGLPVVEMDGDATIEDRIELNGEEDELSGSFQPEIIYVRNPNGTITPIIPANNELHGDEMGNWLSALGKLGKGFKLPKFKFKAPRINFKAPKFKMKFKMPKFKAPSFKMPGGGGGSDMLQQFMDMKQQQDAAAQEQAALKEQSQPEAEPAQYSQPTYEPQPLQDPVQTQAPAQMPSSYTRQFQDTQTDDSQFMAEPPERDVIPESIDGSIVNTYEDGEELYGEYIPRRLNLINFGELNGDEFSESIEINGDDLNGVRELLKEAAKEGIKHLPVIGKHGFLIKLPALIKNHLNGDADLRVPVPFTDELYGLFDFLNPAAGQAKRKKQLMLGNALAIASGNKDLMAFMAAKNVQNAQKNKKQRKRVGQITKALGVTGAVAATVLTAGIPAIAAAGGTALSYATSFLGSGGAMSFLTKMVPTLAQNIPGIGALMNGPAGQVLSGLMSGGNPMQIIGNLGAQNLGQFASILGEGGVAKLGDSLKSGDLSSIVSTLGDQAATLGTPEGANRLLELATQATKGPDGKVQDLQSLISQYSQYASGIEAPPRENITTVKDPKTGAMSISVAPLPPSTAPKKSGPLGLNIDAGPSDLITFAIIGGVIYMIVKRKGGHNGHR
jgi:hypothetical protein